MLGEWATQVAVEIQIEQLVALHVLVRLVSEALTGLTGYYVPRLHHRISLDWR